MASILGCILAEVGNRVAEEMAADEPRTVHEVPRPRQIYPWIASQMLAFKCFSWLFSQSGDQSPLSSCSRMSSGFLSKSPVQADITELLAGCQKISDALQNEKDEELRKTYELMVKQLFTIIQDNLQLLKAVLFPDCLWQPRISKRMQTIGFGVLSNLNSGLDIWHNGQRCSKCGLAIRSVILISWDSRWF